MRSNGKYGTSSVRLILSPNIDTGSSKQTGQRSVTTPTTLPRPLALLVPTGQLLYLLRQRSKPIFNESNRASVPENTISPLVAAKRGNDGKNVIRPNSQLKKVPNTSRDAVNQSQNIAVRTNRIVIYSSVALVL